jgi:coiled-coil-helix-coiled-coil-helix domain-containing protein 10
MALGTGSALAHRAVDSVLGSRNPEPAAAVQAAEQVAAAPSEPCSRQAKTFTDCMSDTNGDLESCRYYFDTLQTCRQASLS